MEIRLAGTVKNSIVDGPGLRYTIFVQGCPHHCEGCHNPHTHRFDGGHLSDTDSLYEEICRDPIVKGVTFSGGEPFCQAEALAQLGKKLQENGYHIMAYTGYTFEQLQEQAEHNAHIAALLRVTDVLVDGPFELGKKNLLLQFRGSENQRILDCKESFRQKKPIEAKL